MEKRNLLVSGKAVVAAVCGAFTAAFGWLGLSLIHISEPTRRTPISYAVFCLKKKKKRQKKRMPTYFILIKT